MEFTTNAAKEFFWSLRRASVDLLGDLRIPLDPAFKTSTWKNGRPVGITMHYTAGISWRGSASWLNSRKNTHSSCHMLILDRKIGEFDDVYSPYPILDELPVTVIMLADLKAATWHATWSNGMNFGIENRNAGLLKMKDDVPRWWGNNWDAVFPEEDLGKKPVYLNGNWWEPYTAGQLESNVIVGRMLHSLYSSFGGLNPSWVIPHSCVQMSKCDTGPAFPMAKIRQAIFSDCAISDLSFLKDYERHPQYMNDHQDFVEADMSLHGDRSDQESALTSRDDMVLGISHSHLMGGVEHLPIVAEALETLGYCSRSPGILHTAVVQFQKCAGLTVDGVPGSDTCLAIKNRLNGLGLNVPAGILV